MVQQYAKIVITTWLAIIEIIMAIYGVLVVGVLEVVENEQI